MEKKSKITAIIVAAGTGSRMGSREKKQFMELDGIPVMIRSVMAFDAHPLVDSIVLVVNGDELERAASLCARYGIRKISEITEGGNKRFRSVRNGLAAADSDTDYVIIHDGARPFVSKDLISSIAETVPAVSACTAAVPVKDTIKRSDASGFASETLDRDALWAVQTPQAFSYRLLVEAYEKLIKTIEEFHPDENIITDDAVIIESFTDCRVRIVKGEYSNIKITTPEDMIYAEAILKHFTMQEEGGTGDTGKNEAG